MIERLWLLTFAAAIVSALLYPPQPGGGPRSILWLVLIGCHACLTLAWWVQRIFRLLSPLYYWLESLAVPFYFRKRYGITVQARPRFTARRSR